MTDFDEFAGIAVAIFLALTLLIPHLDGADVVDPASRRQPTQGPTDRLRSFEGHGRGNHRPIRGVRRGVHRAAKRVVAG